MRFPKAFNKAIVRDGKVYFRADMSDEELVELMQWKSAQGIYLIKPIVLKNMYHKGLYQDEIKRLYKKSHVLPELAKKRKWVDTYPSSG